MVFSVNEPLRGLSFILTWVLTFNVDGQYCHFTSKLTQKSNVEKLEQYSIFLFLEHFLDNGNLQTHIYVPVIGSAKLKVPC